MKSQYPPANLENNIRKNALYLEEIISRIISNSEWGRTKKEHLDVPLFWKHCSKSRYLLSYWVSSSRPRRDESSTLCKYFKFFFVFFGWISYLWGCLTWQPRLEESFVLPCLLRTESLDWVGDRLPGTCNKSFKNIKNGDLKKINIFIDWWAVSCSVLSS